LQAHRLATVPSRIALLVKQRSGLKNFDIFGRWLRRALPEPQPLPARLSTPHRFVNRVSTLDVELAENIDAMNQTVLVRYRTCVDVGVTH
jgi:hypothetical protein